MRTSDSLEITRFGGTPKAIELYSHRRHRTFTVPLDDYTASKYQGLVSPRSDESSWLRFVSRRDRNVVGVGTVTDGYDFVVRLKHGGSRREVTVPCSEAVHDGLLAAAREAWSDGP